MTPLELARAYNARNEILALLRKDMPESGIVQAAAIEKHSLVGESVKECVQRQCVSS